MTVDIFYILSIIGLISIIAGVLVKNRNRKTRDVLYIIGGVLLVTYSIYIQEAIFIVLQMVFILTSIYDLSQQAKSSSKKAKVVKIKRE